MRSAVRRGRAKCEDVAQCSVWRRAATSLLYVHPQHSGVAWETRKEACCQHVRLMSSGRCDECFQPLWYNNISFENGTILSKKILAAFFDSETARLTTGYKPSYSYDSQIQFLVKKGFFVAKNDKKQINLPHLECQQNSEHTEFNRLGSRSRPWSGPPPAVSGARPSSSVGRRPSPRPWPSKIKAWSVKIWKYNRQ